MFDALAFHNFFAAFSWDESDQWLYFEFLLNALVLSMATSQTFNLRNVLDFEWFRLLVCLIVDQWGSRRRIPMLYQQVCLQSGHLIAVHIGLNISNAFHKRFLLSLYHRSIFCSFFQRLWRFIRHRQVPLIPCNRPCLTESLNLLGDALVLFMLVHNQCFHIFSIFFFT